MRFIFLMFLVMPLCLILVCGCGSNTRGTSVQNVDTVRTSSDSQKAHVVSDAIQIDRLKINESATNPGDNKAAKARFAELNSTLESDLKDLESAVVAADSEDAKRSVLNDQNPVPSFIDDMLTLACEFHKTQTGVDAALSAFVRSKEPEKSDVMNFVLENFADRLNYVAMIAQFQSEAPSPQIESWLNKMIVEAPEGETKARAMMGYAKYVRQLPAFKTAFIKNPAVLARLPDDQQQYMKSTRTSEQISALENVLETVINNYSDMDYLGKRTFADVAKSELFELTSLSVGTIAPDIQGADFDGIDFKLSDYRGKIVMLDFWGHWCPPCRQMYPHEQELVKELGSKPFVLIGMNSDRSLDVARNSVRNEGLTWRNFWNGPKGTSGPIAREWNVEAWPTVYLIDAEGVIRHKGILGEDIDRALEQMLAEMGHTVELTAAH